MNNEKLAEMYINAVINPLEKLINELNSYVNKKILGPNKKELDLLNNMNKNLIDRYKYLEKLIND